ncbi:MAG: hypothetical protein P8J87_09795 [Verrucomicrobiales bacterium]|nr:hypothetical protein [Verrucomicrobiales bacterium]
MDGGGVGAGRQGWGGFGEKCDWEPSVAEASGARALTLRRGAAVGRRFPWEAGILAPGWGGLASGVVWG